MVKKGQKKPNLKFLWIGIAVIIIIGVLFISGSTLFRWNSNTPATSTIQKSTTITPTTVQNTTVSSTTTINTTVALEKCTSNSGMLYKNQSLSCGVFTVSLTNVSIFVNGTKAISTTNYLPGLKVYYNNSLIKSGYFSPGIANQTKVAVGNNTIYILITSSFASLTGTRPSYAAISLSGTPYVSHALNYSSSAATGYNSPQISLHNGYQMYICGGAAPVINGFSWKQTTGFGTYSSIGYNSNGTCFISSPYEASEVGIGVNSRTFTNYTQSSQNPIQANYYVSGYNSTVFIIIAGSDYSTYPGTDVGGVPYNLTYTGGYPICNEVAETGTATIKLNGTSTYGTDIFQYSGADTVECTSTAPYTIQISASIYNGSIGIFNFN
ncbi:MAG: hypothetical protein M1158_02645 [Candidatus Marsarchaeota archaeon]|nr:hypothetical protein [Candidatus Marsarchaeota archaeon]